MKVVIGVDPGPDGITWAKVAMNRQRISVLDAGSCKASEIPAGDGDVVWVETVTAQARANNALFATAITAGMVTAFAIDKGATVYLVPRWEAAKLRIGTEKGGTDARLRDWFMTNVGAPGTKKNPGATYKLKGLGSHGIAAATIALAGLEMDLLIEGTYKKVED